MPGLSSAGQPALCCLVEFVNQQITKLMNREATVNAVPTTAKCMDLVEFLRPNYWGKDLSRGMESPRSGVWSWLNCLMNVGTVNVEIRVFLPEAFYFSVFCLGF